MVGEDRFGAVPHRSSALSFTFLGGGQDEGADPSAGAGVTEALADADGPERLVGRTGRPEEPRAPAAARARNRPRRRPIPRRRTPQGEGSTRL